ncbi:MAG: PQQ-dependent sugar dehydrogenase [Deltaproteobacteria bacterium]|nr:PQQ-dependent sugar dehydrogenase [Deltaproteobacteria bacterium]
MSEKDDNHSSLIARRSSLLSLARRSSLFRIAVGVALGCIPLAGYIAAVRLGYLNPPFGAAVSFAGYSGNAIPEPLLAQRIHLPDGFRINTYAGGIPNARLLRFTPAGDLLVSAPGQSKVLLVERDRNGDGVADGKRVLLDGLTLPHGLALHGEWLYIADATGVLRVGFDSASGSVRGAPERIVGRVPDGGSHWTRTVAVGPDEKLYLSVGSSCNVCQEADPRRAAILRYDLDGRHETIYATGLRNSVGLAWQPGSGALYATDNGRDWLGDDFPPCELNRIVEGGFYGWPFANGDRVPDPDFGAGHDAEIAASIPPAHGFGAHTAPLGISFYDPPAGARSAFPSRYRGAAFVAQHGSWNRTEKAGYRVVALQFAADGGIREEVFANGFLRDGSVSGRPVDVAVGPDGALYVSDDFTGSIYRITYER